MKFVKFSLAIFATFCLMTISVKSERFQIPVDLSEKYLGISVAQLFQKCDDRNMHCRTVMSRDLIDVAEEMNGERLINLLVNLTRQNPPMSEEMWQSYIDRHCHNDMTLKTLSATTLKNLGNCAPELDSNKEGFQQFVMRYLPTYCSRIEELAKQRAGL